MKAILLDIEGTTTPIDFVHKVLFPFSAEKMLEFIEENFSQIQNEIAQLEEEHRLDFVSGRYVKPFEKHLPSSVADYLLFLISQDRKSTPLKSLQGKIWQIGYESGQLKSIVFDDVPPAFNRWKAEGKKIAIFSSGSILAQKLLFKYTNHGDLTPFISAYFDTNTGNKKSSESYKKIAEQLKFNSDEILFISDVIEELNAARDANFQTALSVRDNKKVESTHRVVNTFDEI
ncbi:MAG: acireductone synthase [Acidobacteria bacterium]|jgi:enolase-phosphatase E1|nr:MAG: acireductone synthase [Acidobacteriota bacterium]GIU81896.1 MAG: enolase-phosphatase E1 [Pyrinomonadaceae bacterium]